MSAALNGIRRRVGRRRCGERVDHERSEKRVWRKVSIEHPADRCRELDVAVATCAAADLEQDAGRFQTKADGGGNDATSRLRSRKSGMSASQVFNSSISLRSAMFSRSRRRFSCSMFFVACAQPSDLAAAGDVSCGRAVSCRHQAHIFCGRSRESSLPCHPSRPAGRDTRLGRRGASCLAAIAPTCASPAACAPWCRSTW